MKIKIAVLLIILLMAVVLAGCVKSDEQEKIIPMEIISSKKAVLIIAFEGFQDFEYDETRRILESSGVEVTVASSKKGSAVGKLGQQVEVDLTLDQVKPDDFDAIVFIGGPGASEYESDPLAHKLAQLAMEQNKVLGAICLAPTILAKAGVLENKRATVWSDPLAQEMIEILKSQGADYTDEAVVIDGKLITANGPSAAKEFGQKIVEALNK